MKIDKQIYNGIMAACKPYVDQGQVHPDYEREEIVTMLCTAQILKGLEEIKEALQQIRTLQLWDHKEYVDGRGEKVEPEGPEALMDQPVWSEFCDYSNHKSLNCGPYWIDDSFKG